MVQTKGNEELIYCGKIFNVLKKRIELDNRKIIGADIIQYNKSVVILPVMNENILLLHQFRYPFNEYIYEFRLRRK